MSRPTEIMFVASAQSTRSPISWNGALEPPARLGDLVGGDARGQLHDLGERLAVLEEPGLLADALAARRSP